MAFATPAVIRFSLPDASPVARTSTPSAFRSSGAGATRQTWYPALARLTHSFLKTRMSSGLCTVVRWTMVPLTQPSLFPARPAAHSLSGPISTSSPDFADYDRSCTPDRATPFQRTRLMK